MKTWQNAFQIRPIKHQQQLFYLSNKTKSYDEHTQSTISAQT